MSLVACQFEAPREHLKVLRSLFTHVNLDAEQIVLLSASAKVLCYLFLIIAALPFNEGPKMGAWLRIFVFAIKNIFCAYL